MRAHIARLQYFSTGAEKFNGPKFHSAEWDHNVDISNKRVGVIGTGASAVQIVPGIADRVKELHVFQRTPCWTGPRFNTEYSEYTKVTLNYNLQI